MAYQRKRVEAVDDDRLKFEISTIVFREVIFEFMPSFLAYSEPPCKLNEETM